MLYMVSGEDIETLNESCRTSAVSVYYLFLNAKQNKLEQVYRISRKSGVSEVRSAEHGDTTLDFTGAVSSDNLSPSTPIKANNGHG